MVGIKCYLQGNKQGYKNVIEAENWGTLNGFPCKPNSLSQCTKWHKHPLWSCKRCQHDS